MSDRQRIWTVAVVPAERAGPGLSITADTGDAWFVALTPDELTALGDLSTVPLDTLLELARRGARGSPPGSETGR